MGKSYSSEGDVNLGLIDKQSRFTGWMYEQIRPFLRGDILEIGSGRGTYSMKVIRDFQENDVFLTDVDEKYVRSLKKRFGSRNVSVRKLDLESPQDFGKVSERFDTVFALNVLEHVRNDMEALKSIRNLLKEDGRLILLVPAHKFLYNCMDRKVGHYRRYDRNEIVRKAKKAGYRIDRLFYFNFASIIGWYWHGSIRRKSILDEKAMGLLDALVPFLRVVERYVLFRRIGMSLVVVLERRS